MIDIERIRREPDAVKKALLKRMDHVDLDAILGLDGKRRDLVQQLEQRQARRNQLGKQIGQAKAQKADTSALEAEGTTLRAEIEKLQAEVTSTDAELRDALAVLPNLPDDNVPAGGKESNQVVRTWGEPPKLPAKPLDHVELCTRLGLVDYARGVKLGGNGSWLYTGAGARLEWALVDFFIREHLADGYTFLLPPHLLLEECGFAAGQFPKFRDDVYFIRNSDRERFLLPTSETAIINIYRDEILTFDKLPIKAFAYTPCYRRESGGYRTEERGTIRGHQFNKVELFQFVPPEGGDAAIQELVRKVEVLVEKLGLHYRTSLLAAGDASASMAVTYDVEVSIPSIGAYKECSSASLAREYQARRANIRFKRDPKAKTEFVHTLNASGLATSRLLPAIVEQCQQEDGSVRVPEPLRAFVGTDVLRSSRTAVSGRWFGSYLVVLGAAIIVVPNTVLGLVAVAPTREVWIRVAGFLAAAIGYYYLRAAAIDDRPFFRWTVHMRLCVPPLFGAFVLLGLAPPQLMLFAAPDLAGAIWTALALRSDG